MIAFLPLGARAHDERLHQQMSISAFRSSDGLSKFLEKVLGVEFAPYDFTTILSTRAFDTPANRTKNPAGWLAEGSYQEDMQDPVLPSWVPYAGGKHFLRGCDHFYTVLPQRQPGEAPGLSDNEETKGILPSPIYNSYLWASTPATIDGPAVTGVSAGPNFDTWWHARQNQYDALTFAQKSDRVAMLALMLYRLGHVIHINQDLSQPEHVRNDAHPLHRAIEEFGYENYLKPAVRSPEVMAQRFPLRPQGWLYWRDAGFTKLRHFWDRGLYFGNASALDHDADGDTGWKLGLAEFTSGNFLGQDSTYAETAINPIHVFPFPSRNTSTTYLQVRRRITSGDVDPMDYPDGSSPGGCVYLRKIGDGLKSRFRHSVMPYLTMMRLTSPQPLEWSYSEGPPRINDPNVLMDYHSILIPKAIEYSAGILDYFFRGKLEVVDVVWHGQLTPHYTITVRNKSGDTLKDGAFSVMKDDENSNRTCVTPQPVPLPQPLADNATWDFDFPGPRITTETPFMLVYQGSIGVSGNSASDPVDGGIAIAAQKFSLCNWCTTNAPADPTDFEHWTCTFLENQASGTMANLSGSYDVEATWDPLRAYRWSGITFNADEICCPTERSVTITFDYTAYNEWGSYSCIYVVVDGVAHYSPFINSSGTSSGSWSYNFTLPTGTHTLGWHVASLPNDIGLPTIRGTVTIH